MYRETTIDLPNGMEIIVWNTGGDVCVGIVDKDGYALTDKQLSVEEADKLNSVSYSP